MSDDVLHFPFAVHFPRDVLERIDDLRIDPLVHIFDDFVVMVVMRVHIQGFLGFCGMFFLALGDGDDVAVILVFEGVGRFGFSIGKTFDHADMVAENILDGDERENEEYA
jgi:hypothetical protein